MLPMTNSPANTPGDIVIVPFPFADLHTSKKRPALVLNSVSSKSLPPLVTIAMITSQVDGEKIAGDCLPEDWAAAGLLHPSKIRLSKLATVEQTLILQKIGSLSRKDEVLVRKEFKKLYSLWLTAK